MHLFCCRHELHVASRQLLFRDTLNSYKVRDEPPLWNVENTMSVEKRFRVIVFPFLSSLPSPPLVVTSTVAATATILPRCHKNPTVGQSRCDHVGTKRRKAEPCCPSHTATRGGRCFWKRRSQYLHGELAGMRVRAGVMSRHAFVLTILVGSRSTIYNERIRYLLSYRRNFSDSATWFA